jgi:transcriptional regulator with XRE-family HTH domain
MNLNEAVRQLRVVTGETQQSFAQRLGVSIRAVTNYEKDRAPNDAALFRLAKLSRQVGRVDLAQVFSAALSDELQEVVEPMTKEERVWSAVVLALLRHRELTDWPKMGHLLVKELQKLLRRHDLPAAEDLAAVLLEARYNLASKAELELQNLAKARQAKTGETYYQAYSQVLIENPDLYTRYLQERAAAARGTPYEKSMALPKPHTRQRAR